MSFIPLLLGTVLYACTAAGFWYEKRGTMAVVYIGYVIANLGFLVEAWRSWK